MLRLLPTLLSFVWASICSACSCMESPLAQRVDWSTHVFIAKVIKFHPFEAVEMEVTESFKGSGVNRVTIAVAGSDCDYFLPPIDPKPDERYLIFMTRIAGKNIVSRCLGSGPSASKVAEISILRGRAKNKKSQTSNQPLERTPPRCALRRRSTAR